MTNPDDDYDNPVGEILDPATIADLSRAHFVFSIAGLLKHHGVYAAEQYDLRTESPWQST